MRKNTQRKANGGVRKFGKEIVAMVICLAVLFYTVQFTKGEEAYYTIRVTNDVVAGGALFLLGWCAGGIETKYHRGKK